jgi:hypothetical protein
MRWPFLIFVALPVAAAAAEFERDIRPLLQRHCVECHGAKKQKGELRLDALHVLLKRQAFNLRQRGPEHQRLQRRHAAAWAAAGAVAPV